MEQIFESLNMAKHFIPTSSRRVDCAMRLHSALLRVSIVWINGPYECGLWPDISISGNSLKAHLAPNERVEAGDGNVGEHSQCCKCLQVSY